MKRDEKLIWAAVFAVERRAIANDMGATRTRVEVFNKAIEEADQAVLSMRRCVRYRGREHQAEQLFGEEVGMQISEDGDI